MYNPQINNRFKQLLAWTILGLIVVLLVVVALVVKQQLTFHVTGTSPHTNSMATISKTFSISFNHQLREGSVQLTGNHNVVAHTTVNGKDIVVTLQGDNKGLLDSKTTYTLTLKSVSDVGGKTLTNQTFTFTPKYIAYQQLSQAQQKEQLDSQSTFVPGPDNINFTGEGGLTALGISPGQLSNIEWQLYDLNGQTKAIVISVSNNPQGSILETGGATLGFTVSIDGIAYNALLTYGNSASDPDAVSLTLTDSRGTVTNLPALPSDHNAYTPHSDDYKRYPVLKKLPYTGPGQDFSVSYGQSVTGDGPGGGFTIFVNYYSTAGLANATQWLQTQGLSTNDPAVVVSNPSGN